MAAIITDDTIREAVRNHAAGRTEMLDALTPGLSVRVGARGATWSIIISAPNGSRCRYQLGRWPRMSTAKAREAARALKENLAMEPMWAGLLGELIDDYCATVLSDRRSGSDAARGLDRLLGGLRHRRTASITRRQIREAAEVTALWRRTEANRSLAYVKAFFEWAVATGRISVNPARYIVPPVRERVRTRRLKIGELVRLWDAAEQLGYPFGQILRLLILTGAKTNQVAAMREAELELDGSGCGLWTIPAERAGARRPTLIHLSPLAVAVLQQALSMRPFMDGEFVFSTTGNTAVSGWSHAKKRLDDERAWFGDVLAWRFDDVRKTVRDHLKNSDIKGASDAHRAALEAWSDVVSAAIRKRSTVNGGSVF